MLFDVHTGCCEHRNLYVAWDTSGEGSDLCFQKLKCFSPGIAVKFNCILELLMLHTFEVLRKHVVQVSHTCNQKSIAVSMHRTERCITPGREH